MKEYIERDEAEKRLFQRAEIANSAYIDQSPYQIMMLAQNVVHLIPAANVRQVVTCERCAYHVDCGYHYCNKWCVPCPDDADFFCAYGEES